MTDRADDLEWLADMESLVRAAGDYVRPSDDLRPRVLEKARVVRKERQAQRWTLHLAACALVGGLLAVALQSPPAVATRETAAAAIGYRLLWTTQPPIGASDASWSMVDSYTELRRRQAELLRPAM
jgi:hypothetical protein